MQLNKFQKRGKSDFCDKYSSHKSNNQLMTNKQIMWGRRGLVDEMVNNNDKSI